MRTRYLPDVADVLRRHIVRRCPFLAIPCLIDAERKRSSRKCLLSLGQASLPQLLDTPGGICDEVVQGLCVAFPRRFGDGWQGLPFDLGKHPNMEVFEVLKAPHIWKHILIELTIVINKGHGRSGRFCLRHPFLPPLLTEL
jgi:hypothetical protein